MRNLTPIHWLTAVLLSASLLACAPLTPRSFSKPAVSNDNVSVQLVNPDQFPEMRQNRNFGDLRAGSRLVDVQKYIVHLAGSRVGSGQ